MSLLRDKLSSREMPLSSKSCSRPKKSSSKSKHLSFRSSKMPWKSKNRSNVKNLNYRNSNSNKLKWLRESA